MQIIREYEPIGFPSLNIDYGYISISEIFTYCIFIDRL